eukprot:CAMPEP_0172189260 /NCGR_PEP_ID=MMETSP1050-20130122/22418_1 /TAXON_ID=233186 /ORGANISM="Cryptomonas curvata, Strain CCAP979/52" /LENGTH=153 /DNA_ID=CAMNT_0012863921 /DNA_START=321 /DNA_END=779 /DNA_ORIENTATION=+
MSRYLPANSTVATRHQRRQSLAAPVILCHGAFANRVTYDLGAGRPSLAVFLAERGYDVWALELRGHGRSQKPPWLQNVLHQGFNVPNGDAEGSWSVMAYIQHDLPAAVDYVRSRTGAARVHWVGHSMGGIVVYSWLAFAPHHADAFASVVTVG